MTMSPIIAVHMTAALAALAIGPIALWARRGHVTRVAATQRPRLHRAAGYAWVTLMLLSALSALFIRDFHLPNVLGYSPIHLFVPFTLGGLWLAFAYLLRGNLAGHRKAMLGLYLGGCIGPAVFALLPARLLGRLVWGDWLGWV